MAQESECWVLHIAALYMGCYFDRVVPSVNRKRLADWLGRDREFARSPEALSNVQLIDTWPPPPARRSPSQNVPGDHHGFINLVQNPSGLDLLGWSPGVVAAAEAKGVTRGRVDQQLRGVEKDLGKLADLRPFGVATWMFVDARPHDLALEMSRALVTRVLKGSWPKEVQLALVTADEGFPKSCMVCGHSPWVPREDGGHADFLLSEADLDAHTGGPHGTSPSCLRRCGYAPNGEVGRERAGEALVAVLDPRVPPEALRNQLAGLPPRLWPDAADWAETV